MNLIETGESQIETPEEQYGTNPAMQHKYWWTELDLSMKAHREWKAEAARMVEKFRGKDGTAGKNRMNIFWSNVSTLQPALFQKMPSPVVERRFKQKDPVARAVAMVLERAISYQNDIHDAENHVKAARDDYLLAGRGVLKIIYRAEVDEGYQPTEEEVLAAIIAREPVPEPVPPRITEQDTMIEQVPWDDFLCSPEGVWRKKRWVAYRTRMNRKQLIKRFGKAKGNAVNLNKSRITGADEAREEDMAYQMFKEVDVWEVWDKEERRVIWISDGYTMGFLDEKPDPYQLRNFFPSPKPIQVLETSTNDQPVTEYSLYEDQAAEINRLTDRIYKLADKIRAVGAFAGQHHDKLSKMLTQEDGTLIPIDNWAAMMEGKGLRNNIEWAPIKEMVETLNQLLASRQTAKNDLYEVTGLSDILRGSSDATETATAQRIKGQFATLRLDERKRQIARMISEAIEIMGELIAEHFEPEILAAISGLELFPTEAEKMAAILQASMGGDMQAAEAMKNDPTWEDVIEVLRSDFRRSYAVRVETEDTIEVDRQADKQQRIEFLTAFVQLLQAMSGVVAQGGMDYNVAKEIIMFSVRGFSQARSLEEVLEDMQPPQKGDEGPSDAEIKQKMAEMKGQIDLLLQARDHQFQAAEGDKNRQAQIAQTQLQAIDNDADRAIGSAEKAAEMNFEAQQKAADRAAASQSQGAPV